MSTRIKDIGTTATTPASDDYLELDGSTNGSRKILATDIKTAVATDAETLALSLTTKAVTPSNLLALMERVQHFDLNAATKSYSGTGVLNGLGNGALQMSTGATASSTWLLDYNGFLSNTGTDQGRIDFSKPVIYFFRFGAYGTFSANAIHRLAIGNLGTAALPAASFGGGMGVTFKQYRAWLYVCLISGSTVETDTGYDVANQQIDNFALYSDGAGTVKLIKNGTVLTTVTGGCVSANFTAQVKAYGTNGADSTNNGCHISRNQTLVAQ